MSEKPVRNGKFGKGGSSSSRPSKQPEDRAHSLKRELSGQEPALLRWAGISWPPANRRKHIHCPFPGHDDKNPSWRWDGRKRAWFCSRCGGGDIIRAVQLHKGLAFLEACDLIESGFLGRSAPNVAPPPPPLDRAADAGPADHDTVKKRLRAIHLWNEAKPIEGTLAQTYFQKHRRINLDWASLGGSVRYHAAMWCSERQGHFPAILFRVSAAPDGELMTLHRLYLGTDGGKAKIAHPKKAHGDFAGGAIWFGRPPPEGGELVKTEGPEDALVCLMADRPFVACSIAAANLKNVAAPASIAKVLIAGDRGRGAGKGKAGEDYAEDAALADRKRKLSVSITYPPARPKPNGKWQDWNDLLLSDGLDAVREALSQSEPWGDLPQGFRWQENGKGLEYLARVRQGEEGDEEEEWDWLCSHVKFLATTLNADSKDWGLYLQIRTRNSIWHTAAIPKTELVTSAEDIFKRLAFLGLDFNISPRAKTKMRELLVRVKPSSYALCVPKIGFHDGVFILPDETIGDTKGRTVVFQPGMPIDHFYRRAGSLKGWQDGVASLAVGNDRLMFAIAAAFAPPLLELLGMEGGGIHFQGGSTAGKTTILRAASTVWVAVGNMASYGPGARRTTRSKPSPPSTTTLSWRWTRSPRSSPRRCSRPPTRSPMAAKRSGCKRRPISGARTPGGSSSCRRARSASPRNSPKSASGRRAAKACGSSRSTPMPAKAWACSRLCTAFPGQSKWPRHSTLPGVRIMVMRRPPSSAISPAIWNSSPMAQRRSSRSLSRKPAPRMPTGKFRVAQRFGLIAAGGEMAISAGIVPWEEARAACKRLFAEWIAARGTSGPIEIENGIAQVKRSLELDGASRFTSWHSPGQPTLNRLGFYRTFDAGTGEETTVHYVLPEGWKEICRGTDPKLIARALVERGVIRPDEDGKFQRRVRLPGMGVRRCYEIHGSKLSGHEISDPLRHVNGHSARETLLNGSGVPQI